MLEDMNKFINFRILIPNIILCIIAVIINNICYTHYCNEIKYQYHIQEIYNARMRFLEQKFLERKAYSILDVE